MTKHKDIMKAIENLKGIEGAYLHPLSDFIRYHSLDKEGHYRARISWDGKQMFKDVNKGLMGNFKLKPYILFIDDSP